MISRPSVRLICDCTILSNYDYKLIFYSALFVGNFLSGNLFQCNGTNDDTNLMHKFQKFQLNSQ